MYIPPAIWRRDTTHTWCVSGITKEKPEAGPYGAGHLLCNRGLPLSVPPTGVTRMGRREDKATQSQRHKSECRGEGNEEYAPCFHITRLL
jgi:hypothetical protein